MSHEKNALLKHQLFINDVKNPPKGRRDATKSGVLHKVENSHDKQEEVRISEKKNSEISDPTQYLNNSEFMKNETSYEALSVKTRMVGNPSDGENKPSPSIYDNTETIFVEDVHTTSILKGVQTSLEDNIRNKVIRSENDTMNVPVKDNNLASSEQNKGISDRGQTGNKTKVETVSRNEYENIFKKTSEQSKEENTRMSTTNTESTEGQNSHTLENLGSIVTVEPYIKTNSEELAKEKSIRKTTLSTIFKTTFRPSKLFQNMSQQTKVTKNDVNSQTVKKSSPTASIHSTEAKTASATGSQITGENIETVIPIIGQQQAGIPSTAALEKVTADTKIISTIDSTLLNTKNGSLNLQAFTIKARTYHTTAIADIVHSYRNVEMATAKTDNTNVQLKENKPPEHATIPCNLTR